MLYQVVTTNWLNERPLEMSKNGTRRPLLVFCSRFHAMEKNPFFWKIFANALLGKVSSTFFFHIWNTCQGHLPTSMLQHKVGQKIFDITLSEISPLPSLHPGFWHILTITLQTVAPVWYRQWIIHILNPTVCRTWAENHHGFQAFSKIPVDPPTLPVDLPLGGNHFLKPPFKSLKRQSLTSHNWSPFRHPKVWFYRPI